MKIFIKEFLISTLRVISRILKVLRDRGLPPPSIYAPGYYAYKRFIDEELSDSYEYFKKFFYTAIFLPEERLRKYAIEKSLKNDPEEKNFYIEFGVYEGISTNFFSSKLKKKFYGFDSFEGFKEDWHGTIQAEGDFSLKNAWRIPKGKKGPTLNDNVVLEIGWVQDTLQNFIDKNPAMKINFVHMDMDTYETSKFILEKIKPYLKQNAIICFDELYNYEGWKVGEFKALTEVFKDDEYLYKCFSNSGSQVVIEFIGKK